MDQTLRHGSLVILVLCASCGGSTDDGAGSLIACTETPSAGEVCIAGGEFVMGHDPLPKDDGTFGSATWNDFSPPHTVRLAPFFMDVYPATTADYLECFQAGQCPDDDPEIFHWSQPNEIVYTVHDSQLSAYPAISITFEGAQAYCRFRQKRLPTEAEWERAARGPHGDDYPWGNDPPDCEKVLCDEPLPFGWDQHYAFPAGTNPTDVSVEGVHDLVTNGPQHVADIYMPDYYASSPLENPTGPDIASPIHVLRGRFYGGNAMQIEYDGATDPWPAWVRDDFGRGGLRCARTDGNGG